MTMILASKRVLSKSRHLLNHGGSAARKKVSSSVQAAVTARYCEGVSFSTSTLSSSHPTLLGWGGWNGGCNNGWQNDYLSQQNRWRSTVAISPSVSDDSSTTSKEEALALETAKVIREIKADLVKADVNNDGKIDSEELKAVLRKYSDVFTDKDVLDIAEMFYVGKAGSGVPHEDFLKAVSNVMYDKADLDEGGVEHRKIGGSSHPLGLGKCGTEFIFGKVRGVYTEEELDVKLTHVPPKTTADKIALQAVGVVRFCFDWVSLWKFGKITQPKVLRRVIFLETVAAIPGFVAAMVRHFKSLRNFSRDGGMLNMFLDEANNERMHLLSFVRMRDPGNLMRFVVLGSQVVIGSGFLILYALSPTFCHRFVGYVEEEACHTYTTIIDAIENAPEDSDMAEWRTELAPAIARGYWHLGENGTVLDMMYAIRADEAEHRDVNHVCSGIREGQVNPLYNPQDQFDKVLQKYVQEILKKKKD